MSPLTTDRELPMEQRILAAEQRLLAQRRSARVHLASAEARVRRRLTAPATLMFAVGVGIAMGQITSWRKPRASSADARGGRIAQGAGLLAMLLDALSISAPVVAMIAAVDRSNTLQAARTAHSNDHPT